MGLRPNEMEEERFLLFRLTLLSIEWKFFYPYPGRSWSESEAFSLNQDERHHHHPLSVQYHLDPRPFSPTTTTDAPFNFSWLLDSKCRTTGCLGSPTRRHIQDPTSYPTWGLVIEFMVISQELMVQCQKKCDKILLMGPMRLLIEAKHESPTPGRR